MEKFNLKVLSVLLAILCFQSFKAQTLTTDKPDYPPGDTAILTGTGFQPGEIITMQVHHAASDSIPDTGEDHFQWYVTADASGGFITKWHVCEDDCAGANLLAAADGNTSGKHAEVAFTDALKTDTYPLGFSAFTGTATYCQGAVPTSLIASWTNTTCNGTNPGSNTNIPITITWYKNSAGATSGGTVVQTSNTNAGTTSSSFIPATNTTGTLFYYVVISWAAGPNCAAAKSITTSATKAVIVNPSPSTPTITAGGPVSFCQGGSVVLSASSAPGNQWYNNSGLIAGETDQTYTATAAGSYSVIATIGTCSSNPSAPINVTVNPIPTGGVSILAPNPGTVCAGLSTTIKFSGTPNASLSYNKNGAAQAPVTLNNGGILSVSTGNLFENTVYEVASVTSNGCIATTGFSPASVTVVINQPPSITLQPNNQSVVYGSSASFVTNATGTGLTYQWQQDAGSGFFDITDAPNMYSGATSATLNVSRPTVSMNNYKYRVVVSGICSPPATSSQATLSVSKASLTVIAEDKNKIYGDADPALTYTPSGTLYYDDSYGVISGVSLSTATGSAAVSGTHVIVASGGTAANYDIIHVNGILTVSPRPITITADPLSKVYGALDPALTYQVSSGSLSYGDVLPGSLSRIPGESVQGSPYAIEKGSLANSNYTITYVAANFSITPLSVTVTAAAKMKTYGDVDPSLTYTSNPQVEYVLANGEAISFAGSLSRVAGENVGIYAINQGSLNNTNYSISYIPGTVTVTPLSVSVTAEAKTKVYGDLDPSLTFASSPLAGGVLANGETVSFTGSLSREAGESVGTYTINQGSLSNTNYNISYTAGNLTITPLSVSVTTDGKTKAYGDVDPVLTFVSNPSVGSALANGELISYTGNLARVAGEGAGTYAVNKGSLNNTNYSISYIASNLTITPLSVSVTADGKTKAYGDIDPVLTFVSTPSVGSALANGEFINYTGNLTRVAGESVGTYSINQGSLNNTNYNISYTAENLSITPLSVTVTAASKSKMYGNIDPPFTFTSNPSVGYALANGELISYTGNLSRVAGENVGMYTINQGSLTNTNYNISFISSTLSITPLPVSVTAIPNTKTYGSVDPALTYSSVPALGSTLPNGQLISFTGSLLRVAGETVGTYSINQGNLSNTNYNIFYTGANFSITAAPVTAAVSVSPNPQQYSDLLTYCVKIIGGAPKFSGGPQAASSVNFKIGSQVIATNVPLVVSGSDLKATYTLSLLEPSPFGTAPVGQMAPGSRVVAAVINNTNSNYLLSTLQPTTALTISPETAQVVYTGGEFASTGSATSTTAKIRLSASVIDAADGYPGDIRNAKVRFRIQPYTCDIAMTPQTIVYTSWRSVSLINSADISKGTAVLDTSFNIGTCDARIYDVAAEVGGYYSANSDIVTISVAKSMNDFVSGGGHLDIGPASANQSAGTYKSSDNSKVNWGFNVKYNKNKTNLQGNANIIIRSGGKTYQVKGIVGGSNGALAVNVSDPSDKKATLTAKANVIDMATGLAVNYGSNATMQLKMSDKAEPGVNQDTYGITIWGSNGSLLYSSNWAPSTNSTNEVAINGGNIQIGSTVAAGRFGGSDSTVVDSLSDAGEPLSGPYIVKIFPNPTNEGRIIVSIIGTDVQTAPVELYISDINGRLIYSDQQFCLRDCKETAMELDRRYKAGIYLVDIIMEGKVYHQKLIVQ